MGRKGRKRMESSRMASSRLGSFFQEGNRGSIDNVKMKIRLSNMGIFKKRKLKTVYPFLILVLVALFAFINLLVLKSLLNPILNFNL